METLWATKLTSRRGQSLTRTLALVTGALLTSWLTSAGCDQRHPLAPPGSPRPGGVFREVAESSGLRFHHRNGATGKFRFVETTPGGCGFLDYDHDGWLDIVLVQAGTPPGSTRREPGRCLLFHNNRRGGFEERTAGSGLEVPLGYAHGVATGDFDNDGRTDLYVTAVGGNRLFRNLGAGQFNDVTQAARVADTEAGPNWATSAAFGDYNNDGHLDLFVCHYCEWSPQDEAVCVDRAGKRIYCEPTIFRPATSRLYRNTGHGTFVEVTQRAGIAKQRGRSLGVVWFDYDGDGWQDLYVANDMDPNFLFHNQRNGTFREIALEAGAAYGPTGKPLSGMGVTAGDYDNDGREDLYVTNFSGQTNSLYHNEDQGYFTHATASAGLSGPTWQLLGFGVAFFDYNRDGWLDLVVGNGHVNTRIAEATVGVTYAEPKGLYRNAGDGKFIDAQHDKGPMRCPRVTRGLAVGDFNNDGRLDVLASNQNDRAELFRNESQDSNHWISLRLLTASPQREALGARVWLQRGGERRTAECRTGYSYLSAHDPRVFFGLGPDRNPVNVTIAWPGGNKEEVGGLATDRIYVCVEGQGCQVDERTAAP